MAEVKRDWEDRSQGKITEAQRKMLDLSFYRDGRAYKNRYVSPKERFELSYEPVPEAGCWIWIGRAIGSGYGNIRVLNKQILAHRYSYMLFNGEIPFGLQVCHKCDVRLCVNPEHLFLGTAKDNALDRESKGRNKPPQGESHHWAKLSEEAMRAIRADNRVQSVVASEYGISQGMVSMIKAGKRRAKC